MITHTTQMADCDVRVFAGDFVQGSIYDSVFGTGLAIAAYNAVGYDIVTFGNHEFDNGAQPVYDTILGTPNITWLSSNVFFDSAPPGLSIKRVHEAADICWISALTQSTVDISSPGPSVFIHDPVSAMYDALASCSQTDNVVAVTHVGYEQDVELCHAVPELDLIIGGHSHTDLSEGPYPSPVRREDGSICWVVTASAYGRYLGVLNASFKDGKLKVEADTYLPLDNRVPLDAEVNAMIGGYTERLAASVKQVIGYSNSPIDGSRSSCRSRECAMGNLVCDAMLAYAGPKQGADICIQNGGGLRASIDKGDVTIEEVFEVLPFGLVHTVFKVSGAGLVQALEIGFCAMDNTDASGRFPQVGGMAVTVDYSKPSGKRVVSVVIGDEAVDNERIYTVVTNSFLAGGGDNYKWDGATDFEIDGIGLDKLTGDYIRAHNPYSPATEGRIRNIGNIAVAKQQPLKPDIENFFNHNVEYL